METSIRLDEGNDMGELYDQLVALTIAVTSPDGNVKAVVRGAQLETARFRAGAYQEYGERGLEHQLARLCTLAYTGHQRGSDEIHAAHDMRVLRDPSQARDQAEREYMERVRSITVVGAGPSRYVRFKTAGMMHWQCRIAQGTLATLTEDQFVEESCAAVREVLRKTAEMGRLLKDEFFNRELSKELRNELMANLTAA